MKETVAALVSQFEGAAKSAQQAEAALRKTLATEIARLERQRAFAFRRTGLIRMLASSAADLPSEDEAVSAQCRALSEELGWRGESEEHKTILAEIRPLGRSVWQCVCGNGAESRETVAAELEKFEVWFQGKHGTPFYALFDQYVPEAPLVDF